MDNHAEGDDVAKLGQLRAFRLFLASCYLQLISDDISATATAKVKPLSSFLFFSFLFFSFLFFSFLFFSFLFFGVANVSFIA